MSPRISDIDVDIARAVVMGFLPRRVPRGGGGTTNHYDHGFGYLPVYAYKLEILLLQFTTAHKASIDYKLSRGGNFNILMLHHSGKFR